VGALAEAEAKAMEKQMAGLIKDLKSRGMLDDTIVHWVTEFGRMPCSQGSQGREGVAELTGLPPLFHVRQGSAWQGVVGLGTVRSGLPGPG